MLRMHGAFCIYCPRPLPKKSWAKLKKTIPRGWKGTASFRGQNPRRFSVYPNHPVQQDYVKLQFEAYTDAVAEGMLDTSWVEDFSLKLLIMLGS